MIADVAQADSLRQAWQREPTWYVADYGDTCVGGVKYRRDDDRKHDGNQSTGDPSEELLASDYERSRSERECDVKPLELVERGDCVPLLVEP